MPDEIFLVWEMAENGITKIKVTVKSISPSKEGAGWWGAYSVSHCPVWACWFFPGISQFCRESRRRAPSPRGSDILSADATAAMPSFPLLVPW